MEKVKNVMEVKKVKNVMEVKRVKKVKKVKNLQKKCPKPFGQGSTPPKIKQFLPKKRNRRFKNPLPANPSLIFIFEFQC